MAKITCVSELMQNHKQAVIMSADKKFEALETEDATTIFFSIGDDGIFYITKQLPGEKSGWIKEDLSSALNKDFAGKSITAKSFKVTQRLDTHTIDLVLAISVDGEDHLYVLLSKKNSINAWNEVLNWAYLGCDALEKPKKVVITDLYIAQSHSAEYIVVDILKNPDDGSNFIYRYFIDPTKNFSGYYWNPRDLAGNLDAGKINTELGKKANQEVDGIYTLGSIQNKQELIYTPVYNYFNPKIAPNPSRLSIDANTTALATITVMECTGLFVASGSKLQYFPPEDQNDNNTGFTVVTNALFEKTKFLRAYNSHEDWVVWGLNEDGYLFYTKVKVDSFRSPEEWSVPIPILSNVEQVACYLNSDNSSSVLFALIDGQNMIQLIQDPITTQWQQRQIVLPSTNVDDVIAFSTYTSHVLIKDDYNLPLRDKKAYVTSTSPVSVYVNNEFKILSATCPTEVASDVSGAITIVQQTHTIGAVCYFISFSDVGKDAINVNPMNNLVDTVGLVKTGEDLGSIKVTNADGSQQYLVPQSVPIDQKDVAASLLQKFVTASISLPSNGSVKDNKPSKFTAEDFISQPSTFWGASFNSDGWKFFEGGSGMIAIGIQADIEKNKISFTTERLHITNVLDSAIDVAAGDMYSWLKKIYNEVTDIFTNVIKDVYHVYITVKDKMYHFILNCINDVVQGFEFILNKIQVLFEDLIKWLGFIFNWNDILRSHKVLKNIVALFLNNAVQNIGTVKNEVDKVFNDIDAHIKEWAGLEILSSSVNNEASASPELPGQNSPQANYGISHFQQGLSESSTTMSEDITWTSELEAIINTFIKSVEKEGDIFENAYNTLKTEVVEQLNQLTLGEIVKRLVGIIANIIVESVENLVDTALDIIQELIQGVISLLIAPINIPVLSWLYSDITEGEKLSLLDVVCLVCAIPGTVVYKMAKNESPFPDDQVTRELIAANSWSELKNIVNRLTDTIETSPIGAASISLTRQGLTIFMRAVAGGSSLIFAGLTTAKALYGDNKVICALHGIAFFTTTAPNIAASLIKSTEQKWFVIVGEVVYGITVVQKITEIFSFTQVVKPFMAGLKVIDFCLGVAGLIPTFASLCESNRDGTARLVALNGVCWNGNRMFTPFAKLDGSLPQVAAFGAKLGCIVDYGILEFTLIA